MEDSKPTLDNSTLYKLLDEKCERCGKPIGPGSSSIWIGDASQPNGERLAYFCSDECFEKWWDEPPGNPCSVPHNID